MKAKFYCYSCEVEFTIKSDSEEGVKYCPFCGEEIDMLDADNEDEDG